MIQTNSDFLTIENDIGYCQLHRSPVSNANHICLGGYHVEALRHGTMNRRGSGSSGYRSVTTKSSTNTCVLPLINQTRNLILTVILQGPTDKHEILNIQLNIQYM